MVPIDQSPIDQTKNRKTMNSITSLRAENAELISQKTETLAAIEDFMAHLHSAKFQGFEVSARGLERKDWISTSDVIIQLHLIRGNLI